MSNLLITIAASIALSLALPTGKEQQLAYHLPSGVEKIVGDDIRFTFSCQGRSYGYYADMDNDCQIFHVCVPQEERPTRVAKYSFFCPNQTVFSQADFVCMYAYDALPCEESESFYFRNEEFGKTEKPSKEATSEPSVPAEPFINFF